MLFDKARKASIRLYTARTIPPLQDGDVPSPYRCPSYITISVYSDGKASVNFSYSDGREREKKIGRYLIGKYTERLISFHVNFDHKQTRDNFYDVIAEKIGEALESDTAKKFNNIDIVRFVVSKHIDSFDVREMIDDAMFKSTWKG